MYLGPFVGPGPRVSSRYEDSGSRHIRIRIRIVIGQKNNLQAEAERRTALLQIVDLAGRSEIRCYFNFKVRGVAKLNKHVSNMIHLCSTKHVSSMI